MGVLDGYPTELFRKEKVEIVKKCVDWWGKLKGKINRLCQVHGDFHPYNILWQDGDFITLDRSRGEFGEPADDTTSLAMNYIFWSITKHGKLAGDFRKLFDTFFEAYFEKTGDKEMLEVIQPYFTFRAVVVANPVFYPDKWFEERGCNAADARKKLLSFANKVLDEETVDFEKINEYIGD
jgi:aminoglycoside phosphotransferase family enzyme